MAKYSYPSISIAQMNGNALVSHVGGVPTPAGTRINNLSSIDSKFNPAAFTEPNPPSYPSGEPIVVFDNPTAPTFKSITIAGVTHNGVSFLGTRPPHR